MPKYGLISQTDANTIELTLRLIFEHFPDGIINVTEVGIYAGETGNGMRWFIENNERVCRLTGIDNEKDNEAIRFNYDTLIIGDADEVAYKLKNDSQHLILIDACHCFAHTISNFFSYCDKVIKGGYIAIHDTGEHIKAFKDFQHGHTDNPDAYISVRKALKAVGLIPISKNYHENNIRIKVHLVTAGIGWELIFDEADASNGAGGFCVFKKL